MTLGHRPTKSEKTARAIVSDVRMKAQPSRPRHVAASAPRKATAASSTIGSVTRTRPE